YPGTTTGRAGLPFCVPPSRARTPSAAPRPATTRSPKATRRTNDDTTTTMPGGSAPAGTGLSTRCPSTTPVGLALGPDSPRPDQPSPGTLGHPAVEILTPQTLLLPAFSLPAPPHPVTRHASPSPERSPTQTTPHQGAACRGFGGVLSSPAEFSAQSRLTSELLRTLSRMAASKPTSWLSQRPHILSHSAHTSGP